MAQSSSLQMGARAEGMGYASSCLSDTWSLNNNIAGLAKATHSVGAASYEAIPSAPFFNRISFACSFPVKSGVAGAGIFRFGDDLYNELVVSLGFANTYGLASLGAKANYIQYRVDGMKPYHAISVSFGGLAEITPQVSFGAHIVNINQPRINELTEERLPTRLLAGIAFDLSTKLIVAAEIEKDMEHTPSLKGGLEYQPFKKFAFRSGFNLQPDSGFFGMGFKTGGFDLDYAIRLNRITGFSHQASVSFLFRKE